MVRVTQYSKTRNDPLGQWSPYGTPTHRAAPGEWAPTHTPPHKNYRLTRPESAPAATPSVAHRSAPQLPRSHFIGIHLQQPPRSEDPLEGRAVARGVQWEARCRVVERKLQETLLRIPPLEEAVLKQEETIAVLKNQLAITTHALNVANSRIWQPGNRVPDENDRSRTMLHGPAPPRAAATSVLDELDFARPIRFALLRGLGEESALRGKTPAELANLLYESGVLEDLSTLVSDAFAVAE